MKLFCFLIAIFILDACNFPAGVNEEKICINGSDTTFFNKVTFEELFKKPSDFNGKVIELEGYLAMNFEDVALYKSNKFHKDENAKYSCWINFGEYFDHYFDSTKINLKKYKIQIKGTFNSDEKGHSNLYIGELDSVLCIQVKK